MPAPAAYASTEAATIFLREHSAAGEPGGVELIEYVDGYGTDRELTRIINTTDLWFIPVINPDGYDHTFTPGNRLWRKNLRDNNGDGQITTAIVRGIQENTARYNNTFIPRDYTTATTRNYFEEDAMYVQAGARHHLTNDWTAQYVFNRTTLDLDMTFREDESRIRDRHLRENRARQPNASVITPPIRGPAALAVTITVVT